MRDPTLKADLERLVEPTSRGEPDSPLRWTCKSTRELTAAPRQQGHPVSHTVVAELLHRLDYSLQANRKVREGGANRTGTPSLPPLTPQWSAIRPRANR